jgi:hypothetical protein
MYSTDRKDAPGAGPHAARPSGVTLYAQTGPAAGNQLAPVRRSLAPWAPGVGADEETIEAVTVAANQALSNVIGHPSGSVGGCCRWRISSSSPREIFNSVSITTGTNPGPSPLRTGAAWVMGCRAQGGGLCVNFLG